MFGKETKVNLLNNNVSNILNLCDGNTDFSGNLHHNEIVGSSSLLILFTKFEHI